jgi:hypothetical protein
MGDSISFSSLVVLTSSKSLSARSFGEIILLFTHYDVLQRLDEIEFVINSEENFSNQDYAITSVRSPNFRLNRIRHHLTDGSLGQ